MPMRAARPCTKPGCKAIVRGKGSRCELHPPEWMQRPSAADRGYDAHWHRESRAFLREHPFCCACEAEDVFLVQATVVDHHVPHRGDPVLFWDRSNWRPMCASHHSRKTAAGDGGFGNPVVPTPL